MVLKAAGDSKRGLFFVANKGTFCCSKREEKAMKRYLLLAGVGFCCVSGAALAAIDCATPPSCGELGYNRRASEYEGKRTLKCPFDQNWVYWPEKKDVDYYAGAILYSNGLFYDEQPLDPVIKPIGVNITDDSCWVIPLTYGGFWGRMVADVGVDSKSKNHTTSDYMEAGVGGENETEALAAYSKDGIVVELNGEFTFDNGVSYPYSVANAAALKEVYNNKSAIEAALAKVGGDNIAKYLERGVMAMSSTEVDADNIIAISMRDGSAQRWRKDDDSAEAYGLVIARCD